MRLFQTIQSSETNVLNVYKGSEGNDPGYMVPAPLRDRALDGGSTDQSADGVKGQRHET